jgi:hypothetical protein
LRGFRTQADPRIGGSGFSQLGTLPTLRVARCTLQSPRDQRCMQDGIVTNPIGSLSSGAPAGIAGAVVEQATHLLRKASSVAGAPDLRRVADDVIDIAEAEPGRAADLLEAMKPQLSLTERQRLAEDMAQSADAKAGRENKGNLSRAGSLALDMAQLALSIAGIFDPTPTCDAIDGVISLLRGDYVGAAISAASMIPYAGDLAKAGKLKKLVDVTSEAADLAKQLPSFAKSIAPDVANARQAMRAVDASALPRELADSFGALGRQLDRIDADGDAAKVLDLMNDMKAQRRAARDTAGTARRIEDLVPGKPVKVITEQDLIVEDMVRQGQQLKRADALAAREAVPRTGDAAVPDPAPVRQASSAAVARPRNALPAEFVDGPPAPPEKLVFRDADHLLAHFGLKRIADDPELAALWRAAHDAVAKPGNDNVYTRALDKLAANEKLSKEDARAAFGYVRKHFAALFEARYGFRPADVEHVTNLAKRPELALDPRNLSVTRAERELGTKVHELLHWIKSGGDSVNDPRVWWLQVYADTTGRFNAMTDKEVEQAVRELLEQYGVKKPS